MSLLKLLFDLPEAGGESNFTVEEQEELMAFEHNLDEHLVEDFGIPAADDQLGFLQGAREGGSALPEPVQGRVDLPVANGTLNKQEVDAGNGVGVEKELAALMNTVNVLENGHGLGNSAVEHARQVLPSTVALRTQAPISFEKDSVSHMPLVSIPVPPESTSRLTTLEPALGAPFVSTKATATSDVAASSMQQDASVKKYQISSKHQGSGKAVWIKWRGKWQAAIQVGLEDCRAATVKAMPSYGKKKYIPIYVVTNRTYIWIDAQNICDINQNPKPLLSGNHSDWRHRVVDTGAPRRRIFLSLGWEMLDISDRLHIYGVVERARYVSVWKEFATEASEATKYSELGSLLVRIHAVVESDYVRQSWVQKRLNTWTEECLKAETAATIEKLTKECIRVTLWDKAAKLWEAPEQPVLDPGWTDWKGPAFDELTDLEDEIPIPADKPSQPASSSSLTPKESKEKQYTGAKRGRKPKDRSVQPQPPPPTGGVTTRKQVKVEKVNEAGPSSLTAAEYCPAAPEPVALCSQTLPFSVDATKPEYPVDRTSETKVVASELQLTDQGSGVKLPQDGFLNSSSKTWKWKFKSDAWGCSAYLTNKKRRCPRQAVKGIYCIKHQGLAESPMIAEPNVEPSNLCMARYWVENRRCANSVVEGSYYCIMHADCRPPKSEDSGVLNDKKDGLKGGSDKVVAAKHLRCTGVTVQDAELTHSTKDDLSSSTDQKDLDHVEKNLDHVEKNPDLVEKDPDHVEKHLNHVEKNLDHVEKHPDHVKKDLDHVDNDPDHVEKDLDHVEKDPDHVEKDPDPVEDITLAASVEDDDAMAKTEQLDLQSSGRPTEKHLRGVASNFIGGFKTNGTSVGPISDKNLSRLVANMNVKERRSFLKARDLLCKYMNEGLSLSKDGIDKVKLSQMMNSVTDECAKDFSSGEVLLKILTSEKERLAKMVLENGLTSGKSPNVIWESDAIMYGSHREESLKPEVDVIVNDAKSRLTTSFPSQVGGKAVGQHTSYLCSLCDQNFEQLSVLGKHWKEHHKREARLFEKCLLCRVCDKGGAMFRDRLGVLKHWREVHPTIPHSSLAWSVCVMCDKQYLDFDRLWQHVEDQHHYQWSSADFAGRVKALLMLRKGHQCSFCSETFSTLREVQQHKEILHKDQEPLHSGAKRSFDAMNAEVAESVPKRIDVILVEGKRRYQCRYCSLRFRSLPELGRHSQSDHKDKADERSRYQSSSSGVLSVQTRKTKQEGTGGDWHGVSKAKGEGDDKDGKSNKRRHRARTKAKNAGRGRSVPMKKQSGGAEAILQRMRAVKQVLEDQKTKRPPRKRDRKAERARRLAKLAGISSVPHPALNPTPVPAQATTTVANMIKCRFCGLEFALLPDLARHHQAEHSAIKQAFIINGRGECQTGIYTLTKDGIIGPLQGELLNRAPNSRELLEVARSTCCKDWFFNELGKRYAHLPPRLFVQAAQICSEAKLEIRWHQDKYVCPDGCKTYVPPQSMLSSVMNVSAFAKPSSNACAGDAKAHTVGGLDLLPLSKNVISNKMVLSEDLSNGLEKAPIRCVVDGSVIEPCTCSLCTEGGSSTSSGDSQPWNNFVYITQRHLDPSLGLDTKSSQVGCSCTEDECSASTCDHVSMFDTDNAEARTIDGKSARGQFPYDENGRVILDVGYMVYECNSSCQCKDSCRNRVLQNGVRLKLEVFKSRHKGWGVRAAEPITRGTFVCEYIGEVLNDKEANERGKRYDQVGCSYLYNIDAHLDMIGSKPASKPFVIDATKYGNVARFINHSCEPNLINYEVLVESMDCQLAHIGFFANRDIAIGEELAYDYRYKLLPGKGCPCYCGASKCRGRLY